VIAYQPGIIKLRQLKRLGQKEHKEHKERDFMLKKNCMPCIMCGKVANYNLCTKHFNMNIEKASNIYIKKNLKKKKITKGDKNN
jgi:hypothetical protein